MDKPGDAGGKTARFCTAAAWILFLALIGLMELWKERAACVR